MLLPQVLPIIPEERVEIALELEVLARFSSHRNIARFYAAYLDPDAKRDSKGAMREHLWLVMQYCAYGAATTLVSAIRSPQPNLDGKGYCQVQLGESKADRNEGKR